MLQYETVEGDVVDEICFRFYGRTRDVVEQVYAVNRHLSKYDVILPAGVKISLPEIKEEPRRELLLWD
ncbi:MAG: tail protein X [Oligoflexus sp.]